MPSLRLTLDASGLKSGATEAARAVDSVGKAAEGAAKALDGLGEAQDSIYGGGTRIYTEQESAARKAAEAAAQHRQTQLELAKSAETLAARQDQAKKALQGTAAAVAGLATVRNLISQFQEGGNSIEAFSNAALLGAQALLNLERVLETISTASTAAAAAEDALAVSEAAAATGATTLTAALAANPLTAVAAVLATASVAMSLFADKSEEAAKAQQQLADALVTTQERAKLLAFQQQSGQFVNQIDELNAKIQQINQLKTKPMQDAYSAAQLAPLLGMTEAQLKAQKPYDIPTSTITETGPQSPDTGTESLKSFTESTTRIVEGSYNQETATKLFADAVRRFSAAINEAKAQQGEIFGPQMPPAAQPEPVSVSQGATMGPSYREFLDAQKPSGPRYDASIYIAQLQDQLRMMRLTREEREVEQALQKAGVQLTEDESQAVRNLIEQQQELARTQAENEQRMVQIRTEAKAHYAEEAQRQKQRYEDYKNNAVAQYDYIQSLREQTRIAGMSNEQGQQELAVLQAVNIAKQNNQTLTEGEAQNIREQIDLQQQLGRLKEISASVDSALSGAFTGFITGATTARQAVAALIQQMIALASQQAFRGATSALFNLFAPTASQSVTNLPNGGASISEGGLT